MRRPGAALALLVVILLAGAARSAAGGAQESEPGGGSDIPVQHPDSRSGLSLPGGVWLAGDVTLTGEVPEGDPAKAELDDLSVLLRYEPVPRLALFTEIRLEDSLELVEGEELFEGPANLVIARLYGDWSVTPHLTVRAGKFFMPFGLWNVIHRAPLRWTVDEPAVVNEDVFPKHATGLSLIYQTTWHGWSLDATGYGPAQDKLAFRATPESGLLFGGRAALGHSIGNAFAAIGLNAAEFRPDNAKDWTEAYGLDLDATVRSHHLTAEFIYTRLPAPRHRSQHGLYVQDAVPLTETLYGVVRFEYFQPPHGRAAAGQLIGLFWQPIDHVIVKADYQFADRKLENLVPGFLASVSLIF
jgi:hypothetical protein